MDEIDWSAIIEDEDALLKMTALSYFGVALYFALKKKPVAKKEPTPEVQPPPPQPELRSLSDIIGAMMEEAYGIEKRSPRE